MDIGAIRQRIEAGGREGAKRELGSILRLDPENTSAWELLAPLLEDAAQQADCYRQVLRLDPGNREAAARLRALTGQAPIETRHDRQPGGPFPPLVPEAEQASVSATSSAPTPRPGLVGGLLHLLGVDTGGASQVPRQPTLIGLRGTSPRQEPLTPDDIIRLAGGALPPEERQTCPKCAAVISRGVARCPWCGTRLGG